LTAVVYPDRVARRATNPKNVRLTRRSCSSRRHRSRMIEGVLEDSYSEQEDVQALESYGLPNVRRGTISWKPIAFFRYELGISKRSQRQVERLIK
jgi:hypothetical protein